MKTKTKTLVVTADDLTEEDREYMEELVITEVEVYENKGVGLDRTIRFEIHITYDTEED